MFIRNPSLNSWILDDLPYQPSFFLQDTFVERSGAATAAAGGVLSGGGRRPQQGFFPWGDAL